MPIKTVASLLLVLALGACSATAPPATQQAPPTTTESKPVAIKDKTLYAMYMIGSDLEDDILPRNNKSDEQDNGKMSKVGAGTDDFKEMLAGWNTLSVQEKANFDFIVAFGGSRKQGWQGVKYADMACLAQDSEDGYFGNATCYTQNDPKANMNQSATLENFLAYLKQRGQYGRSILQFWDHGAAYMGIGKDSNYGKELMPLSTVQNALTKGAMHFGLIGFDACLMANLEVARSLKDHADYMIASEELEPGHGWNYADIVTHLGKQPAVPITQLGKAMVDSFIDSPGHKARKLKTLSLSDLKKTDDIVKSLDQLVAKLDLNSLQPLLTALARTQNFGSESRGEVVVAIDTQHFAENIALQQPTYKSESAQIVNLLRQMVIYNRQDGTKPNANGLSIYSLNKNLKNSYKPELAISQPWYGFTSRFLSAGTNSPQKPTLTATSFKTQATANNTCNVNGQNGHCFEISDDTGVESVDQVYALRDGGTRLKMLGQYPLYPVKGDTGYFLPKWNGEWFSLCDGPCQGQNQTFPPADFEEDTESNGSIYVSSALLNDEDVQVYLELDENDDIIDQWAVPYEETAEGDIIFSREYYDIEKGDTLQFYYPIYDENTDDEKYELGPKMTFSRDPVWDYGKIKGALAYYIEAQDTAGNYNSSDIFETIEP